MGICISEAGVKSPDFANTQGTLKAMRLLLLIISFFFSLLSLGQDSLQADTSITPFSRNVQGNTIGDSTSFTSQDLTVKKKKQKPKKIQRLQITDSSITKKVIEIKHVDTISGNRNGLIIIGLLIIALLVFLAFSRSFLGNNYKHKSPDSKENDFISDYLSRMLLSRREYYRNVYLKSDAWKRKRYLVLKRDHWRCVYCGAKADEVHHTRYAKVQIGKEPIEWLVSICRTCHDSKHQSR